LDFIKTNFRGFSKFQKLNFARSKFLEIWPSTNLPLGHARSHHKRFGSNRFSRFDAYWKQTNRQTNKVYMDYSTFFQTNNICFSFNPI